MFSTDLVIPEHEVITAVVDRGFDGIDRLDLHATEHGHDIHSVLLRPETLLCLSSGAEGRFGGLVR